MEINIDESIKSNILNIFSRFTFDEIENEHEARWKDLYDTSNVNVIPKSDINPAGDQVETDELNSVLNVRRLLRIS